MFDEKDPSPSSLPTSLPSTPTTQLSMMLNDASRCDPRDVANTRSRVPSTGEGEGGNVLESNQLPYEMQLCHELRQHCSQVREIIV